MTQAATETRSVVVEREISYPPEKIWRALTQPHLIEEWLMKNDFKPVMDHRFSLSAEWGGVACQVKAVEPNRTLSYTWDTKDLESVSPGRLPPPPPEPACAWSKPASAPTRSPTTGARRAAGRVSLPRWKWCWRGWTEAGNPRSIKTDTARRGGARPPVRPIANFSERGPP